MGARLLISVGLGAMALWWSSGTAPAMADTMSCVRVSGRMVCVSGRDSVTCRSIGGEAVCLRDGEEVRVKPDEEPEPPEPEPPRERLRPQPPPMAPGNVIEPT